MEMGRAPMAIIMGKVQSICDQGNGECVTARRLRARTPERAVCDKRLQQIPVMTRPGRANSMRPVLRKDSRKEWQAGARRDRQTMSQAATAAAGSTASHSQGMANL